MHADADMAGLEAGLTHQRTTNTTRTHVRDNAISRPARMLYVTALSWHSQQRAAKTADCRLASVRWPSALIVRVRQRVRINAGNPLFLYANFYKRWKTRKKHSHIGRSHSPSPPANG